MIQKMAKDSSYTQMVHNILVNGWMIKIMAEEKLFFPTVPRKMEPFYKIKKMVHLFIQTLMGLKKNKFGNKEYLRVQFQ